MQRTKRDKFNKKINRCRPVRYQTPTTLFRVTSQKEECGDLIRILHIATKEKILFVTLTKYRPSSPKTINVVK